MIKQHLQALQMGENAVAKSANFARFWVYSFTVLLLCGCHVTSTFQKLPQEWVAPKVCAAGTEGYREEEASSPHQNSWQPELQLFKGLLPLLTCHSGR